MKPSKSIYELTQMRKSVNKQMFPHKIVRLDQIAFAGENLFKCDNVEMIAQEEFIGKVDKLINVSSRQSGIVKRMSGESGLNNFKNYLSAAANASKNQKVVLFASPATNTLEDIVALKEEYISPGMFFDFLEILMNQANYEVVNWEYDAHAPHKGMTFYLNPIFPSFEKIQEDEEFITDGIFLRWNVDAVEIGNYFTRLICSNGSVQTIKHDKSKIYSMSSGNITKILKLCKTVTEEFDSYKSRALRAIETSASLSEMEYAFHLLTASGLQNNDADEIIPYKTLKASLKQKHVPLKQIKTSYSLWDIYNRLTDFSSNNEIWDVTDPRRGNIAVRSGLLLEKKPDIVNYFAI